jgi:hypothetical protein
MSGFLKINYDEYYNERRKVRAYIDELEWKLFLARFIASGFGLVFAVVIIATVAHRLQLSF